jgi:hypothetical protein
MKSMGVSKAQQAAAQRARARLSRRRFSQLPLEPPAQPPDYRPLNASSAPSFFDHFCFDV